MKNKSKLKESHEFKEKKRYVYDSFINQKHDSSKNIPVIFLDSNEFKPIKIKNIAIEPFSLAPSYKVWLLITQYSCLLIKLPLSLRTGRRDYIR